MGLQGSVRIQPFPTFVWSRQSSLGGCGPSAAGLGGRKCFPSWLSRETSVAIASRITFGEPCAERCAMCRAAPWRSPCQVVRKGR